MNALEKLICLEKDARQFGFDWPDPFMILDQVVDECREVKEEIEKGADEIKLQEEIGDLLHAAISLCVFCGFDVEETIGKVNTKFSNRMKSVKDLTKARGLDNLRGQHIDFMLGLWREAKQMKASD